ncbi:MAG: SnoaL-like domain-containing protein [Fimbriimonadales bacterium]
MSAKEVADGLVALCSEGKFDEASFKYYSDDIVSVEAEGDDRETCGMDAIKAKIDSWNNAFELHGQKIEGPWVNEPQFLIKLEVDITNKATGERQTMSEHCLYTVENGKIVHERFF